jgi:hypothetical protein
VRPSWHAALRFASSREKYTAMSAMSAGLIRSGGTCRDFRCYLHQHFASAQAVPAAAAAGPPPQLSAQHFMEHQRVMLPSYKQQCCLHKGSGSQSAFRQEQTLMTSDSFSTSGQCCSLVINTRTLLPDTSGEACSSSNTLSLANAGICRHDDHNIGLKSKIVLPAFSMLHP